MSEGEQESMLYSLIPARNLHILLMRALGLDDDCASQWAIDPTDDGALITVDGIEAETGCKVSRRYELRIT